MLNAFWWNLLQSQAISALYLQASMLNTSSQSSTPQLAETTPSPNLSPALANGSSLVAPVASPVTSSSSASPSNPLEFLLLQEQYLNSIGEENRNALVASYFDRLLQTESADQQQQQQQQNALPGSGEERVTNSKVPSKTNVTKRENNDVVITSVDKLIKSPEKLECSPILPVVSLSFPNASKHINVFMNSSEFVQFEFVLALVLAAKTYAQQKMLTKYAQLMVEANCVLFASLCSCLCVIVPLQTSALADTQWPCCCCLCWLSTKTKALPGHCHLFINSLRQLNREILFGRCCSS